MQVFMEKGFNFDIDTDAEIEIILNKNKEISLLNDNIIQKDKIVTEHSNRADFYKKEVVRQKRLKLLSIGSGILGVVASILFL